MVAIEWKAKELKSLVDKTDAPLHDVVTELEAFVKVLKDEQMSDLREALATLLAETTIREAGQLDDKHRQKLDLLSGSMLDVTISDQLAQYDRQLVALADLLHKLGEAHAQLEAGWDAGETVGLDTVKAVGTLTKDIYSDVKAFESPGKEGGS